jgi:hypothetical protein
MWDHLIGQHLRRCNRNLLLVNGALVLIVLVVALVFSRYLFNFFFGPFEMTPDAVAEVKDPGQLWRYYVRLPGSMSKGIGTDTLTRMRQNKQVVSVETTAEYRLYALTPQKWLLVRAAPGMSTEDVTGTLVAMPSEVYQNLIIKGDQQQQGQLQLQDYCMRHQLLDARGFRAPGWWGLGFATPILLLGLFNTARALRRWRRPERHPIVVSLARYGPPDQVADAIAREVQECYSYALPSRQPLLTRNWLLQPSFFGLRIVSLHDVVWVYKKVTKHSVNGVPTGTSHAAVICQRDGATLEVGGNEQATEQMLYQILGAAPWVVAGFDPNLMDLFKNRRNELVDVVEERRKQVLYGPPPEPAQPQGPPPLSPEPLPLPPEAQGGPPSQFTDRPPQV